MAFTLDSGSKVSDDAFDEEIEALKRLQALQTKEAEFLTTEGQGIAEQGKVVFGDQLDLEDLTEEEKLRRSTGQVSNINTGLVL